MKTKQPPEPEPSLSINKRLLCVYSLFLTPLTHAQSSANIGISSNYLWRGTTQSDDDPALSAGLDFSGKNGFYAGSWISTLSDSHYELDLYGGYAWQTNNINYDIGLINYQYPRINDYFTELSLRVAYEFIQASVAYTFDSKDNSSAEFSSGDLYYALTASHELENSLNLGLILGHYDFDDDIGDDYSHAQASIGIKDFNFAVDSSSGLASQNDVTVSLTWTKTFDLNN